MKLYQKNSNSVEAWQFQLKNCLYEHYEAGFEENLYDIVMDDRRSYFMHIGDWFIEEVFVKTKIAYIVTDEEFKTFFSEIDEEEWEADSTIKQ